MSVFESVTWGLGFRVWGLGFRVEMVVSIFFVIIPIKPNLIPILTPICYVGLLT